MNKKQPGNNKPKIPSRAAAGGCLGAWAQGHEREKTCWESLANYVLKGCSPGEHKHTKQPPHLSGAVTRKGGQKPRAALFLALVLAAVQTQGAICCHFISAGVIWDSNGLKI